LRWKTRARPCPVIRARDIEICCAGGVLGHPARQTRRRVSDKITRRKNLWGGAAIEQQTKTRLVGLDDDAVTGRGMKIRNGEIPRRRVLDALFVNHIAGRTAVLDREEDKEGIALTQEAKWIGSALVAGFVIKRGGIGDHERIAVA
jgi:hypothetical protein